MFSFIMTTSIFTIMWNSYCSCCSSHGISERSQCLELKLLADDEQSSSEKTAAQGTETPLFSHQFRHEPDSTIVRWQDYVCTGVKLKSPFLATIEDISGVYSASTAICL